MATLEAVDDYTIKWTFAQPFPLDVFYMMRGSLVHCAGAHPRDFHPKYNEEMDYKDFENALPPDKLPQVTLGPWAAVEYKTDELLIMRRNPYFWQVDEAVINCRTWMRSSTRRGRAASGATSAR